MTKYFICSHELVSFLVRRMAPEMMSVTGNENTTFWNLENGYNNSLKYMLFCNNNGSFTKAYPHRVFGVGARAGLFALLRLYEQDFVDFEYICRGSIPGFKVTLHTPGEIPQISQNYFRYCKRSWFR